MSTNIVKIFLKLVDKHFPRIHRLHKTFNRNIHKTFNRNTIKVSYSYMINVQQLRQKHKNFIENKKNETTHSCNCRDKNGCPLNRNCRTKNVNYKCTSPTKNNVKKVYLAVSEGEFKKYWYWNYQQSFWNEHYKNGTALSKYLQSIKS